ncbi:hypothetical protein LGW85_09110, partial [Streptococcus mutans]|nr:hypothetical protein [Streptococcus mutans]
MITALVMIGGTIGVMIMLNGNNGFTFTNSLKDGHYIQDTDNEDKIKLDIDGNKALVTRSGTSYIWTIDKSKKSFIFKEDDENKKVNYEMIAVNCTPKVRQKKSNFWGVFIMKLTYEDKVLIYELKNQG